MNDVIAAIVVLIAAAAVVAAATVELFLPFCPFPFQYPTNCTKNYFQ